MIQHLTMRRADDPASTEPCTGVHGKDRYIGGYLTRNERFNGAVHRSARKVIVRRAVSAEARSFNGAVHRSARKGSPLEC